MVKLLRDGRSWATQTEGARAQGGTPLQGLRHLQSLHLGRMSTNVLNCLNSGSLLLPSPESSEPFPHFPSLLSSLSSLASGFEVISHAPACFSHSQLVAARLAAVLAFLCLHYLIVCSHSLFLYASRPAPPLTNDVPTHLLSQV